ncbi:uncharacterized protein B0P05DRAFT_523083 [Gilbertella persicaria]|uniref:uncharacterized protein n=1 Tax=Gilbertella persicaria TaxID=101096 RepID=UPI0022208248|nr:uncharacterized protein B0P05DRAFT_523083 [Gilbertella persicaria]KAI8098039.1 hypothetical protein B0P05DRAFT_523083 [Gilbertella persicaria]
MPFILPVENHNTLETFKRIVKDYQHVIENNPTARCMIGFTAARMIRNTEGDVIDLQEMELWLQSLDNSDLYIHIGQGGPSSAVDKILCVIKETCWEQQGPVRDKPNYALDRYTHHNESYYPLIDYTPPSL